MIYDRVDQIVPDDLFLEVAGFYRDARLILKLEGYNPAGSIKLKTAVALVDEAEASGQLAPGGTIVESSSGNLGVALAVVAAARGYEFICVTDENATDAHVRQMRSLGTEVVFAERNSRDETLLAARLRLIDGFRLARPRVVWLDQYGNDENPRAHANRTARSILSEVRDVDYLFVGLGTTGTFVGCARRFRASSPATKLIGVDSVGSVTLGGPAAARHLPGIGAGVPPRLFDPQEPDGTVLVPELDAIDMCRQLAVDTGLLVGASTGSVLVAARRYEPIIETGSTVVAIAPDAGERYLNLLYSNTWVARKYGDPDFIETTDSEVAAP